MVLDTETFDLLVGTVRRFVAERLVPMEARVVFALGRTSPAFRSMAGIKALS